MEVNPLDRAWVAATGGVFETVGLTSPAGKAVAGQLSADKAIWTVSEPLGYDKTYTWSGTVAGSDARKSQSAAHFTRSTPFIKSAGG